VREAMLLSGEAKRASDCSETDPDCRFSRFLSITCSSFTPMSLPSPDDLADRNVDSKDTELRYAAYGARLRTALRAGQRYLAYVRLSSLISHC
jgi:hypothetical protein